MNSNNNRVIRQKVAALYFLNATQCSHSLSIARCTRGMYRYGYTAILTLYITNTLRIVLYCTRMFH